MACRKRSWNVLYDLSQSTLIKAEYVRETKTYHITEWVTKSNKVGTLNKAHLNWEYFENAIMYLYTGHDQFGAKFQDFCKAVGVSHKMDTVGDLSRDIGTAFHGHTEYVTLRDV